MLFEGKNILVTGSTGLIGFNLVCRLLSEGVGKLYATGRSINKLNTTFEDYNNCKELILLEYDSAKPLPSCVKDIDYIFHAAGPMERNVVMNYPVNVILPNILGSFFILEFLKKQLEETGKKGRVIVFSSVSVYNNPTNEDYVATEETTSYAFPLNSTSACYSETKRMTEIFANSYARQYGTDVVIARLSTVYGYSKNIPKTAFFEFIDKACKGEIIVLNGSDFPRRDNIYIDDAINGLIAIAKSGISGEAYNISSNGDLGNFKAVDEIADIILTMSNKNVMDNNYHIKKNKESVERKPGILLDNSKLKLIGWEITASIEDGILKTIIQFRKKKGKILF